MRARWLSRTLYLTGAFLVIWFSSPCHGEEAVVEKSSQISSKELGEIVDLLEDTQKRDTFVKEIKTLIQAKEETMREREGKAQKPPEKKQRQVIAVESVFMKFDSVSRDVVNTLKSTASLVVKVPEALWKAVFFLSQRENQYNILRLLVNIAIGIVGALIVHLILRKYSRLIADRIKGLSSQLTLGVFQVVLKVIPFGVIIAFLFLLFRLIPSFPLGQLLILNIFVILFCYRLAIELFRIILSPEDERVRISSLNDENATYLWVWALRFARYTIIYFIVTRTLFLVEIALPSFLFIRSVLLVVFPILISIFILQIAREIRERLEGHRENMKESNRLVSKGAALIIQYWQFLAVPYTWVIFIFFMMQFQRGFHYLYTATLWTALTVVGVFLVQWFLDRLFESLFSVNQRLQERFPGLEEKTNRHIRVVRKVLGGVVIIVGLGIIGQLWGIPISAFVSSHIGILIITRTIAISVTVGIVSGIIQISQYVTDFLAKEKDGKVPSQKLKTLLPVINTAVRIAVGFIGGIVVLDQLGVNTTPILAGAGIVGLAVGFGSQTLVKDLINGLFILFEESIRVGDWVSLGSNGGLVESIGLRTVRLRDLHGNVHVIPNSSIDTLTNMTKEFSRAVLDVGIAYRENVDKVIEILKEIGEEMRNDPVYGQDILEQLEIFGLDRFEDSAVVIRIRLTTKPFRQWAIGREFNRRMKKIFDQIGIEIPFPHRTIYLGEPKEGPAAPLHIQLEHKSDA